MIDTRTCAEWLAGRIVTDYIEPKNYMLMAFSLPRDELPFGWYSRNWIYIGSAWLQDELRLSRFDYGVLQRALVEDGYVRKGYAADYRIIATRYNPHLSKRQKVLIFDRAKMTPHIEAAKERCRREIEPRRYPSWL